jgi:hypothetical protein
MKILFYLILMILFFCPVLFADEIYLKDSRVLKCEIIQITDKNIEYREQGGRPFVTIEKDIVVKVVYSDGKVMRISGIDMDKIFLKDGNLKEGKIVQVTPDAIMYLAGDSDKKESILRSSVLKIKYSDGTEILISGMESLSDRSASSEDASQTVKEEPIIQKGGFIDSTIRAGLLGGLGFIWGNLHNRENDSFDQKKSQITTYPVYPKDNNESTINHYNWHGGFELGLLLPAFKIPQTKAFGLSSIKFGIIGNYIYSTMEQELHDESLPNTDYSGTLLKYRTINAGPEMNLILSPKSNKVNLVFRFYLLGGYIHKGKITAVPGLREAGLPVTDKSEYSTEFTGYSGTAGAGIRFVSNLAFPVIAGFDLQYTYSKLNFDQSLPVYNGAKSASFHEIGIFISAGIHFLSL